MRVNFCERVSVDGLFLVLVVLNSCDMKYLSIYIYSGGSVRIAIQKKFRIDFLFTLLRLRFQMYGLPSFPFNMHITSGSNGNKLQLAKR